MLEITFFGRGGKGARLASEILAKSLMKNYSELQCFPQFGSERKGQPIKSFVRADANSIRLKCQIKQADYLITLGEDILTAPDFEPKNNLKPNGWLIINTAKQPEYFKSIYPSYRIATFNASAIAKKYGLNVLNAIILGAFAKMTGLYDLENLVEILREKIPAKMEENIKAAKEAYEFARPLEEGENG